MDRLNTNTVIPDYEYTNQKCMQYHTSYQCPRTLYMFISANTDENKHNNDMWDKYIKNIQYMNLVQ